MTATDELRRMLDERGVEWETDRSGNRVMWGRPVDQFHDTMEFKAVDNAMPNGGLNVHICGFTPEQAIEATLGRGTCHNAMPLLPSGMPYPDSWMCSECGGRMDGIILEIGDYCPNCGRKIVVE